MLTRLVDFLKTNGITAMFTDLVAGGTAFETSGVDVSALMDSWLLLQTIEVGGERNRVLYVLKSRGMRHSNQIREFQLTDHGFQLLDTYLGPEGVLTGSARLSQEVREKATDTLRRQELDRVRNDLVRKRQIFEARAAQLRAEFEGEQEKIQQNISESELLQAELVQDSTQMVRSRSGNFTDEKKGRANPRGHAK